MLLVTRGGAAARNKSGAFPPPHTPTLRARQAAKLPMSIIIVGVGQAEFDGKAALRGLRGG